MVRSSLLALTIVWMAAASCSGRPPMQRLRIGTNPWPGYAHIAVAKERGLFAAQGIDADIVEYTSLHDLRRGFAEGQIDVMPSTLVEVLSLSEPRTGAPVVAWIADASDGGDVVVARNVADANGLRGGTIAYEPGTLGSFLLARFLAKHGMAADAVKTIGMDQSRMPDAMAAGQIDAAITYPPFAGSMLALPDTRTIFSSASLPGEIIDTISLAAAVVDADPTMVRRFQAAMAAAHAFCRREPEVAEGILRRATGMHREELRDALAGVIIYGPSDQPAWFAQPDRIRNLALEVSRALSLTTEPYLRLPAPDQLAPELSAASPR